MCSRLLLVPTAREWEILLPHVGKLARNSENRFELCGFGLVASAARTASLLAAHRPSQVILVGIAGSIGNELTVGKAYRFDQVACYGIGVGEAERFSTASEMGWMQLEYPLAESRDRKQFGDVIDLSKTFRLPTNVPTRQIVSCCAASFDAQEVTRKQAKFPLAAAEDMESFSVAMACAIENVPCEIVRGISNRAGDRVHKQWKTEEALMSAVSIVEELLSQ
jgi:futalosine hydrolase